MAVTLGDDSWSDDNMRNYFKKLENNLYIPELIAVGGLAGHGYKGSSMCLIVQFASNGAT